MPELIRAQDEACAHALPQPFWPSRPHWSASQAQLLQCWLALPDWAGEAGRLSWEAPPASCPLWLSLLEPDTEGPTGPPALLGLPSWSTLSPWFDQLPLLQAQAWQPALAELVLAPLLAALSASLGRCFSVGAAMPAPQARLATGRVGVGLRFEAASGGAPWRAHLLPAPHWPVPARPSVPNSAGQKTLLRAWGGLPQSLVLTLASDHWNLGALAQLRAGDVLRLHEPPAWPLRQLLLQGPGALGQARARLERDSITLMTAMGWDTMNAEHDAGPEAADEEATLCVSDLPVQLRFELGQLELPLARLAELREGSVLSLGQALSEHLVTIRAHGLVVGRGELVRLGEEVAVQLLQWKAPRLD